MSLVATPLIPLPGSPTFKTLLDTLQEHEPDLYQTMAQQDYFDIKNLVELRARYMYPIELQDVQETLQKIEDLFPVGIRLMD